MQNTDITTDITLEQAAIYSDFIADMGIEKQLLQSVQEMAELQKEILKYVQYPEKQQSQLPKIIDELGDVYNALDSLKFILDIDTQALQNQRLKKLQEYHKNKYKGS